MCHHQLSDILPTPASEYIEGVIRWPSLGTRRGCSAIDSTFTKMVAALALWIGWKSVPGQYSSCRLPTVSTVLFTTNIPHAWCIRFPEFIYMLHTATVNQLSYPQHQITRSVKMFFVTDANVWLAVPRCYSEAQCGYIRCSTVSGWL